MNARRYVMDLFEYAVLLSGEVWLSKRAVALVYNHIIFDFPNRYDHLCPRSNVSKSTSFL